MWTLGTACCPNGVTIPVIHNSVEIFLQKIHKTEPQALSKDREENERVSTETEIKVSPSINFKLRLMRDKTN